MSEVSDISQEAPVDPDTPVDAAPVQSELDRKINRLFPGVVVRKDLVRAVKGNAIVPSYVLEYLLGQYAASDDEATIQAGIDTVRKILADHYVHRNQSELVKSTIRERGRHRIIDKVTATLNEKDDVYEAEFANLGIKGVLVEPATIKAHPKLLVGGVWCICDIEYFHSEDARVVPWILGSIKPIQLSNFDFEGYLAARREFTTDEWIDLLVQSIGFNPELFGRRAKLIQLVRLIPFVERNYNLVELGPKGTGKSHIFSEFSPHGMLISGGEVTVPKLFVNNANGRIGLVGYWDVVAFDEFAGKKKRTDKALVDIMKNYMANKSFSRGVETLGAEASMVFVGNTSHTVPYMLKNSDLFDELPESYHDSAYLDRLHHYIPGWEVDTIRGEMFSDGYGFVVDYIAEVLKSMRDQDYSDRYTAALHALVGHLDPRPRRHPQDLLRADEDPLPARGGHDRRRSRRSCGSRSRAASESRTRSCGSTRRWPTSSSATWIRAEPGTRSRPSKRTSTRGTTTASVPRRRLTGANRRRMLRHRLQRSKHRSSSESVAEPPLFEGHREFQENQRGVSFDTLLVPYLRGATQITITDPYIRQFHQARNLMELIEGIAAAKDAADEVNVKLITSENNDGEEKLRKQLELLVKIKQGAAVGGINFDVSFDDTIHDRSIVTDTGWKILLGRGLDIFQYVTGDAFDLATKLQEYRHVKAFGVTYIREGE